MICNLKSKTCGEPCRTIENPKWPDDSAQRAGAGGQSDQMTVIKNPLTVAGKK
jgi:hypothetical protein